jgi:hypothetical protein
MQTSLQKYADGFSRLVITAWVGALWGVGYLAAPVLFSAQPDRMLAGTLAGKMFTLVAFLGIVCAIYLLVHQFMRHGSAAWRQSTFIIIVVMLLLTLAGQFGIQPAIADIKAQVFPNEIAGSPLAGRFGMLHGIASVMYLAQSLLGAILVVKKP